MGLITLFQKEKKPKILVIEERDVELDMEISKMTTRMGETIKELQKSMSDNDILNKDAKMAELENELLLIKSKVDSLKTDINEVMNTQVQSKDFITIHDDVYLQDKQNLLNQMSQLLEELVSYLQERPATQDLKQALMPMLMPRINFLATAANNLINDDRALEGIYQKIAYF